MKSRTVLWLAFFMFFCLTVGNIFSESSNADQTGSTNPTPSPTSEKWKKETIDTTAGADYLTDIEREIIIDINMARTDPASYARDYLVPIKQYYKGRLLCYPGQTAIQTSEGLRALDECISQLLTTKPVRELSPKKGLTLAARDHMEDQARTGGTGHTGSDHSTVDIRMNRYGKWGISAGENVGYGNGQARRIVAALLIDDGVASRGHRKNLLGPTFNFIGVAVGPHPIYRKVCVIDFAGAYK